MKKLYKLNSKQQKLVKRLKDIIDQMDKNNIGAVLQAYDVDFKKLYFYNREKVVWSDENSEEFVEIDTSEDWDKSDIEEFCDNNQELNHLKEFDNLTWCCPDVSEMHTIPFVAFLGKAPSPYLETKYIAFLVVRN